MLLLCDGPPVRLDIVLKQPLVIALAAEHARNVPLRHGSILEGSQNRAAERTFGLVAQFALSECSKGVE